MKSFFKAWWAALAVKIALAVLLPLSNDEAYYWVWGHFPQWSYFDHPPMVGWLFFLGRIFEGFGSGVRIPGIVLGHLTLLIWNRILEPYLNEERRTFWLLLVVLSPLIGVGSLIITPDVPLLFFWSLSIYFLLAALRTRDVRDYAFLGGALGLGFCSKYPIVLFVPIALLWLFASGERKKLRWSFIPVTIVCGLVCSLPVLYWNWRNDWASFAFQLHHGFESSSRSFAIPLEYLAGQAALLFPPCLWLATRRREPDGARFLHYFGWAPLAFFLYSSFSARVEANWPIAAHLAIYSLAVINAQNFKSLKITMAIWAGAFVLVLSQVAYPWLPIDPKKLKTSEFHRYDVFLPIAESQKNVFFGSYQMAAAVSFQTRHQFLKLGGMNRRDFYDFLPQAYPEHDRFWVGKEVTHPLPVWVEEKNYVVAGSIRLSDEFEVVEVRKNAPHSHR